MTIPFHRAYITDEEIDGVTEAIRSGWFTMGPKTVEFEHRTRAVMPVHFAGQPCDMDEITTLYPTAQPLGHRGRRTRGISSDACDRHTVKGIAGITRSWAMGASTTRRT